ncbi:MAG: ABC transporter ATP-binding protein [Slackia sp.]
MLELKNLVFEVPVEGGVSETKRIIDDLSLTIEDGRFTVITGPNGGGKSTLAKLIMGIEQPTSGSIVFNGQDITHASITERAKLGIGYGFQQPARFKGMKVKKLLELAAGKRLPALECNEYLAKVGLCSAAYLTREVDKSLSGGEVKRIETATMLARDPKMAIYDEPEAGIDLWSFDRLTETFRDIHETRDDRSTHHLAPGTHYPARRRHRLSSRRTHPGHGSERGNPSQARLHRPRLPRLPAHPAD